MRLFDVIDNDNFLLYASHVYSNPQTHTIEEFYDDINRLRYLKRLLKRYYLDGNDLQERLILNHIITIYNVFGIEGGHKLTFFKVSRDHWPALKTFLVYLEYLEREALPQIPTDINIKKRLKEL